MSFLDNLVSKSPSLCQSTASHAVDCGQSIAWLTCTVFQMGLCNFIVEGENGFPITATTPRTSQSAQLTRGRTGYHGQCSFDGCPLVGADMLEHEVASSITQATCYLVIADKIGDVVAGIAHQIGYFALTFKISVVRI